MSRGDDFGLSRSGRRKSPLQSRRMPPPFGLDYDDGTMYDNFDDSGSVLSNSSSWATLSTSMKSEATGYRTGGPKEARLHRVALLKSPHDTDHLHPIKVERIPRDASPEKLREEFSKFGEVESVYVPANLRCPTAITPKKNFAVVRYRSPDAAQRALSPENRELVLSPDGRPSSVTELSKQRSSFSRGTGFLGICNEPCGERPPHVGPPEQLISLSSCKSRNGYPWGSNRELKYLNPQPDKEVLDYHAIRIEVPRHVTPERLEMIFGMYGEIGAVTCPTPIQVNEFTGEPNDGFAFVRYRDRRDMKAAMRAIDRKSIVIDDVVITGKILPPRYWPTDKTRRYY